MHNSNDTYKKKKSRNFIQCLVKSSCEESRFPKSNHLGLLCKLEKSKTVNMILFKQQHPGLSREPVRSRSTLHRLCVVIMVVIYSRLTVKGQ